MKVSIAWLSDHLKPYASQRIMATEVVQHMVELLERSSIEIDAVEQVVIDLDNLVLAYPEHIDDAYWILRDVEHEKEYRLAARTDYISDAWYLLYRGEDGCFQYATYVQVGGLREGLVPPLAVDKEQARGAWKNLCDMVDYRLTIDNKAITHRPDMWSHRGMARELAALLACEMVPLVDMISRHSVVQVEDMKSSFIRTPACDYFARMAISPISIRMSPPWLALRLVRIDSRPMNLFVDATNYVMFDIGQPLHVFDADVVVGNIYARQAHPGELLKLLDGKELILRAEDCVIADQQHAVSLAGIMGGQASGFGNETRSIIIESAHFDPITLRASATAHHIRTEASSRFEKDLDPSLVVPAAQRYAYLIQQAGVDVSNSMHISASGSLPDMRTIIVTHDYIERKIGISIPSERVISLLRALGILVHLVERNPKTYRVDVPSWRMRDLQIPEDIVEEIARMIGYDAITPRLPARSMEPASFQRTARIRALKHHLAYGWRMQEVHNYAFYDEQFLRDSGITINDAIPLKNPVSEQWQRLVSSLIPHLLKNISQNIPEHDEIRLFEMNETWCNAKHAAQEPYDMRMTLAFIWYTHKKTVDFYEGMKIIQSLSDVVHVPLCVEPWNAKIVSERLSWYDAVQRAYVMTASGKIVGTVGMVDQALLGRSAEGAAFIAELDANELTNITMPTVHYQAASKFPRVTQDISLMVPYHLTQGAGSAAEMIHNLKELDARIIEVKLIDFFEKESWKDTRSLTFRIIISDHAKTLTRPEIDEIMDRVKVYVIAQGASVR